MADDNKAPTVKEPITLELAKKHEGDVKYWPARTPQERLAALEVLRRATYGDEACDFPMQKVFEVVPMKVENA